MEEKKKTEMLRRQLFQTENKIRQSLKPRFLELGLTLGQGQPRILKNLLEHGKMTQKELADACCLDVTTMSRTLDRLEEMGLLIRQINPACRRSWLISLTEEGKEKALKVCSYFQQTDDKIHQGFSEEDIETLLTMLKKIQDNLE